MKKINLLFFVLFFAIAANAQSLLIEEFNYLPNTDLLSQGGWALTSTATPTIKVSPSSISYPGYPSSGTGNEVMLSNTGQDLNKSFTAQTSGKVYASFLVKVITATITGDYFFHVGANVIGSSYFGRVFAKTNAAGKLAFGIQYTSGGTITPTYSDFVYDLNTTYLIVLKYDINGVASNTSIVVNPALTSSEPVTGWLTDAQGTGTKPANIGSVALRQGSPTSAGSVLIDGIHVGTSWADVFAGLAPASTPTISTLPATSITTSTVTLNGSVFSLGDGVVTSYGFCWNRTGSPTISDNFIDKGVCTATGDITHDVTGLIPGARYYVKSFATNSSGTVYGNEQVFTMNDPIVMSTKPVSSISTTSATFNGDINIIQQSPVYAHGFCWNTTGSPTLADTKTDNGTIAVSGLFSNTVTGLTPRTIYYVKAYATDSTKTIYGNEISFTTSSDAAISDSLSLNLTVAGSLNTLLSGAEKLTLKKLIVTGSIDARDFKTMRDYMPALTDINLNNASVVAYTGTDGTSSSTGSIAYGINQIPTYAFNNDSTLKTIVLPQNLASIASYAFYNCKVMNELNIPQSVMSITTNALYLCGALININPLCAGNYSSVDGVLFDRTLSQLIHMPTVKSGSYTIPATVTRIGSWAFVGCTLLTGVVIPQSVITISTSAFSGCTGLNSIKVDNPVPVPITLDVFTGINLTNCILYVPSPSYTAYYNAPIWQLFKSVIGVGTGVSTQPASSITQTGAICHGSIDAIGNASVSAYGFCWNTTGSASITDSNTNIGVTSTTGLFTDTITGLLQNTRYYLKAYATDINGTVYGSEITFTTLAEGGNPVTSDTLSLNVSTAGTLRNLISATEKNTVKKLNLSGNIDARDFKLMRDEMQSLNNINLAAVTVVAYSGTEGTSTNPGTVNYLDNQLPQYAFANDTTLRTLVLPLNLATISSNAFYQCKNLNALEIPTMVITIANTAFNYCKALISVNPANTANFSAVNGVLFDRTQTQLIHVPTALSGTYTIPSTVNTINSSAFIGCAFLNDITIPEWTSMISTSAFSGCTGLNSIRVLNPLPVAISATVFAGVDTVNCILKVPVNALNAYRAADNWKAFDRIIADGFAVTTQPVTGTTQTTSNFHGTLEDMGTSTVSSYGFCWNTTGSPSITDSKTNFGNASQAGAFVVPISGLTPGTKYYVKAYATNSTETVYGNEVSFTTNYPPVNLPLFENFDGTLSTLPVGWKSALTGNSAVYINPANSFSQPNHVSMNAPTGFAMLTLPQTILPVKNLRLVFKAMSYSNSNIQVGTVSDPDNVASFTLMDTISLKYTWSERTVSFSNYNGTDPYIAFRYTAGSMEAFIDDVLLKVAPACDEPTGLTCQSIETRTSTINWQENGNATQWQYVVSTQNLNPDTVTTKAVADSHPVQLTGLIPDTTYHVYVRSVCGSGYSEWAIPLTFRTGITCSQPVNLTATNITQTSADLSWTTPGSATQWQVEYGISGFIKGHGTVISTSSNPYSLTGLSTSVRYQYYVRTICGAGDSSRWSGPYLFDTQCGVKELPISENFDVSNSLPPCWSALTSHYGQVYIDNSWNYYSSPNSLKLFTAMNGTATVIFPAVNAAISTLKLKFKARSDFQSAKLYIGTLSNPVNDTILNVTDSVVISNTMSDYAVNFSKYSGTETYIAVRYGDNLNYYGSAFIDNVQLEVASGCSEPTRLVASGIEARAVSLSWQENGTATQWQYKYGLPGFNPDTLGNAITVNSNPFQLTGLNPETTYQVYFRSVCGAGYSAWSVPVTFTTMVSCLQPTNLNATNLTRTGADLSWTEPGGATQWTVEYGVSGFRQGMGTVVSNAANPYKLTGLTSSTRYQYYVKTECGAGESSRWSGPFTFDTQCGIKNLPVSENFDASNSLPPCWTTAFLAGTMGIGNIQVSSWYYNNTNSNTVMLNVSTGYSMLTLPQPNAALKDLKLKFKAVVPMSMSPSKLKIGTVSNPADISTFHMLDSIMLTPTMADYTVFFNKYTGTDPYVAFKYGDGMNYGTIVIDNILLEASSTCSEPTNLAVSEIEAHKAKFTLQENGTAVTWQYKYGLSVFNPDSAGTLVETGINPMVISVLSPETIYQVYARSVCGSGYSDWSSPVSFTTLPSCLQPTDLTVRNITLTTADVAWTAHGSATQWKIEYGPSGFMSGSGTTVTANSIPYTLTGLNASTRYQYYVRSDCGGGDYSHWSGPFTFDTQCDAKNLPIVENFDGSNSLPPCWIADYKAGTMGTGNILISNMYNYYSYPNSVNISVYGGYAMLTLPRPNANLNTLKLKFKAVVPMATSLSKLQIGTVSDPDSLETFHPVDSVTLSTMMSDYTVYFNKYSGTDSYIAFRYGEGINFGTIMIDNVSLEVSLNSFAIAAIVNPVNSGLITGTGNYNSGSNVTLTASPTAGYTFVNWTENGTEVSTSLIYSCTVDKSRNLVANFRSDPTDVWNTGSRFTMYPNPVKNELMIEFNGNARYEVVTMTGQVVYSGNLIKNVTLKTNSLIPGVYIVKLSTGTSTEYRKIIKE